MASNVTESERESNQLSERASEVVLNDGEHVRLRPMAPSDVIQVEALIASMSRRTVYQRFFRSEDRLSQKELEQFGRVNPQSRMVFVVEDAEEVIGAGRYDLSPEADTTAEIAFAVADNHQRRGIASHLLHALASYARTHGITSFQTDVLGDNHAIIRMFHRAGFNMSRAAKLGTYLVYFPQEDPVEAQLAEEERERRSIVGGLTPLFYPYSVAVIGASRDSRSIGARLFSNLIRGGFTGPVFPVHPTARVISSVKAYPSVLDIPDRVDLAFIVVPAKHVLKVAEECAEKGVKGLVVISAGFAETGDSGRVLEEELAEIVSANGMRMVGPNCMGLLNTDSAVSLDGQFGPMRPEPGNVAISSQSGALGVAILDNAANLGIGISSFVSVGNKADVTTNDLLLYWEKDAATDVILLYLESFGTPRKFAKIARRIGRSKPIVAVKSGRTTAGARAATSHTGSLASLDIAVDALFRQAGVVRAKTLLELFDVTSLLANQPLPKGRRVGVITNAGGPGILAVDALESAGLEVVTLSLDLQHQLRDILSPEAAVANPIDMIASASPAQYRECIDLLMTSDEIDALITIYIPASPEGTEEVLSALSAAASHNAGDKPFLGVYMSSKDMPNALGGEGRRMPVYPFPEQAAEALAKAVEYAEWRAKDLGQAVSFNDIDEDSAGKVMASALARLEGQDGWLEAQEVETLLASYGLHLPKSGIATSEDEAVSIASTFAEGAVLKVIADSAVHKSDVGGVVLDVQGEDAVRAGYREVTSVADDASGALVQEFVSGGHEVLIGMTQDPNFGPLIVFGLGGVFVELIGDVAFRIHPLTDLDAEEMISEVKSSQLLDGYRGGPKGDIAALQETLLRVSALVENHPELIEMDLNPIKVAEPGQGITVVDARIRVQQQARA